MKKRINIISMGHHLTVVVRLHKVNRPMVVEVAPRSLYPNFQRRSLNFERKGVVAYKRLVGRGHLRRGNIPVNRNGGDHFLEQSIESIVFCKCHLSR